MMIDDGNGGPVGQRPGFLVRDNAAEDRAVEDAYREYAKVISSSVGVRGRGSVRARRDPSRRRRSRIRKRPALPPTPNITRTIQERWRLMTDYQSLSPFGLAKIEDPSVNTVAITQIDLDARIAAAFADGAKSNDVATLIKDTEHGADIGIRPGRTGAQPCPRSHPVGL